MGLVPHFRQLIETSPAGIEVIYVSATSGLAARPCRVLFPSSRQNGSDSTSDSHRRVEDTLHRVRAILSNLLVFEYQRQ